MFVDARTLEPGTKLDADLCVIGAGAAGITLARAFAASRLKVALIESGGLMTDEPTQALADGENAGLPYFPLVGARLRFFGGSTNHWEGFCRPLDPIDLEAREEIPHSGWPIRYAELAACYPRAHEVLQLDPLDPRMSAYAPRFGQGVPIPGPHFRSVLFQHKPTRFLTAYQDVIDQSRNVTAYLNANVLAIDTNEAADHATSIELACLPDAKKFKLTARAFILATGAIENARLLLLSNRRQAAGLGNRNDLVGRYFSEHIHFESGVWMPAPGLESLPIYEAHWSSKPIPFATFAPTEETLRKEKLQNASIALTPLGRGGRKTEKFKNREVADAVPASDLVEDVYRLTRRPEDGSNEPRCFGLYLRVEQLPNPDSRLTLSDKTDALGQRKARLAWKLQPGDRAGLRRLLQLFAAEIGAANLGRVRIDLAPGDDEWPHVPAGGYHHMGTTRMHADPRHGVVDANCRVHETDNVYVAGSSVFPTCGYASPTLTLVALALRLADHLKEKIR